MYSLGKLRREWTPNQGHYSSKGDKDISITNETAIQQSQPIIFRPFLGLLLACLHSTFNQLTSVIIKKLPYINPCQLSLIRHTGIFIGILPITIYHTDQIFGEKKHRFLLLLRGFFGATGFYFQIMAYSYLPLAEASIVMSTLPLVTAVIARVLLRESYGLVQCLSLILTVSGIFLVLRLPEMIANRNSVHFDFIYVAGLMAAVGNVLFLALSVIYIRKLKTVQFSVVILYLGVLGMIENSILDGLFIPLVPSECGWDQILCISLAAAAFISNCFITLALQYQPAGITAVQKSSFDILITIIFQIIFFNIYPDWYVIGGACLVIASLTIIGIKNWILVTSETTNR